MRDFVADTAMKVTVAFVLLCAVVLSCDASPSRYRPRSYRGYNRNYYNSFKPKRITGRTWDGRPCPFPNGCIQLPDNNDLMSRTEFESTALNVRTYVMYRITHTPFGDTFRQECYLTAQGDNVFVDFKARVNDTFCLVMTGVAFGTFASTDWTIIEQSDVAYPGIDELQNPTYYFMSDNPGLYTLLFTCLQRSTIRNGFCEGGYYVDIMLVQDPPNNPPFKQIEEELCTKLGLSMDDPSNKFLYLGEACP